jgi:hypothetical protein
MKRESSGKSEGRSAGFRAHSTQTEGLSQFQLERFTVVPREISIDSARVDVYLGKRRVATDLEANTSGKSGDAVVIDMEDPQGINVKHVIARVTDDRDLEIAVQAISKE